MHTFNHLNALYFHPHTLRFTPLSEATHDEHRSRRFPGHPASGSWHAAGIPVRATEAVPKVSRPAVDDIRDDMALDGLDDDGAPTQAPALPGAEDRRG